jgi:hypothetical protein
MNQTHTKILEWVFIMAAGFRGTLFNNIFGIVIV